MLHTHPHINMSHGHTTQEENIETMPNFGFSIILLLSTANVSVLLIEFVNIA